LCACLLTAASAWAESHARIVRLSDVQGKVEIDKNIGLGFETAFTNLPITQGTQVRTRDGRAEVEFEDGSALRLTPDTTVEFRTLSMSDSGKRMSEVHLVAGMAYLDWLGKDELSFDFSGEKIALDHLARFRAQASAEAANVAVFKGEIAIEGPAGKVMVERKKTATFDLAHDNQYALADHIAESPYDSWDKDAASYQHEYAKDRVSSPYGYGLSDLNYYGAYSNVPGFGMMWQPYFTGVGWDPFMNGVWGFYPGYGYMFASAYPWGWLPYRYGSWMFVPSSGWMWQPGAWNSVLLAPAYQPTTLTTVHPLVAPLAGRQTVTVGKAAIASPARASRMVVNAGSAGLGIPRGSLADLSHLNHQVAKAGFVEVHSTPQFSALSESANRSVAPSSVSTSGGGHVSGSAHAAGGASHH
jgi:FecR protein